MHFRRVALVAALAAVLSAAGCGDPNSGTVSGKVTVGGKPLADGTVQFVPVDGSTATAGGKVKDGGYSVKVPVGTMKVSFSAPKVVGQKKVYNTPDSPVMPVTAEGLPARFNEKTELTLTVKSGSNQKDWALEEK
ncbi:MAG: hypothetical protein ACRC33_08840 [Gemmataceae bacterium]